MWKTKKFAAVGALIVALSLSAPAAAVASTTGSDEVNDDIAAIENETLRNMMTERVAELTAQGAEVTGVSEEAAFTSADPGARALPTDCSLSALTWYYGGAVYDEGLTGCSSNTLQAANHDLRITGVNPYNPYDNRVLAEDNVSSGGGTQQASGTLSFRCNNTNPTNFHGFARGNIQVNGTWYSAEVQDFIDNQPCGW